MIQPAEVAFSPEGVPYSSTFDDIYHTTDGGLGQIEHVFMAGNALPQRWQGRDSFTILETGFGLGLSFLATWQAWRDDPQRCTWLHFISVEKYPFTAEDLANLHARWPQFAELSGQLVSGWPALTQGRHDILLDGGQVQLTLLFGDALDQFPQIAIQTNAIYLDGFAPSKNPDMWSLPLFTQLARLAAPDCTLATWSVAGFVRRDLTLAGFAVTKASGFGGKRHMLLGRRQP
ncbi:MAG: tRNA (5-methylaminomethyl-2-thiouridine)(34)-methyltransferase MnmD [Formivibrio sp.]|nr:tRNA (5-methylaminomethyl-2-thiouridine)(34)-methyltransferase MnmD [Formivibrio sp.]